MNEYLRPAPEPIGDVVPGEAPVPITVWYVPAASAPATMSTPLAQRLVANFTHPNQLILDLTDGPQLAQAAAAFRRRHRPTTAARLATGRTTAALIVATWPNPGHAAAVFLSDCFHRLTPGGCVAVILTSNHPPHHTLVGAARAAGLTYLQHIVAAHHLTTTGTRLTRHRTHLRVHTDVLLFATPRPR